MKRVAIHTLGCKSNQFDDLLRNEPKQHVGNILKSSPDLLSIDWNSPRDGEDLTRFFLKVRDGCDAFCTFCIIPYARGKSRSLDRSVSFVRLAIMRSS